MGKERRGVFAVAIRAPSCQDCSKAGAAAEDVMQHTLAESNYFNSIGEMVILIAEVQLSA